MRVPSSGGGSAWAAVTDDPPTPRMRVPSSGGSAAATGPSHRGMVLAANGAVPVGGCMVPKLASGARPVVPIPSPFGDALYTMVRMDDAMRRSSLCVPLVAVFVL